MLLAAISFIIKWIYFVLPAAALAVAIFGAKRWRNVPGAVIVAFVAGLGVAVTLNLAYATFELNPRPQSAHTLPAALAGRITLGQIVVAAYFACGMFLLLRLFDAGLHLLTSRVFALQREEVTRLRRTRMLAAALTRVGLLFGIGLPYVMASVMIYRPRVAPTDNPRTQLGFNFEAVEFVTSDGVKISGWWIPAQPPRSSRGAMNDPLWGTQTALTCHGLASSKSNELTLARRLVPGGYNCLAIDFRAHGQSSGQLTTFGATEKRDVLAAIRWLKAQHPEQCQRIVGVGASMGAAALISAAADDSPEGRSLAAIACYAGYDDLGEMTRSAADNFFAPPLSWLTFYVGLPMAEMQSGCDLRHYAPARDVASLWPRPLLLIHAERDELINFDRGRALLDAASQPKYHVWFSAGSHNDLLKDDAAAKIVLEFFRTAKSVPVI